MSGSNILFILSGSIACYKACEAISQLVQRGHRVRTVATDAALRFVGAATLEPIDGVRMIANTSTGATGAILAEPFARERHDVVLLRAVSARRATGAWRADDGIFPADIWQGSEIVGRFDDRPALASALEKLLSSYSHAPLPRCR